MSSAATSPQSEPLAKVIQLRGVQRPKPSLREYMVIALLAEGKSSKEIGIAMGIETSTAETHRANIYRRMGFTSLVDVTHYALAENIVPNKYLSKPEDKREWEIGRLQSFFEIHLGRKFTLKGLTLGFGASVTECITEINRRHGTLTIINSESEYWAIER
jgi:DNA-binding CsgD family transcriptional regulator